MPVCNARAWKGARGGGYGRREVGVLDALKLLVSI